MIAALREVVVPVLRDMGFSGSFPHFRRIRDWQIDLLTFQFNRYGGSFVVEVAFCAPDGFTTHWGKHILPNRVRAHDIHPRQRLRLGSHPSEKADRARGRVQRVVIPLDPGLDHARIELQRIRHKKCVFKGAIIGPNPR